MLGTLVALALAMNLDAASPTDSRPDMTWWREARFGLFIHWGLYSVPAGKWRDSTRHGEWIMHSAQIPIAEYEQFVHQFNPVRFDADEWVRIAEDAGMRYLVITTKHHDGFALWPSRVSDYTIAQTPFRRDIMREIADACRRRGIVPGWYHSIMDWHHPDYLPRREWETRSAEGADFDRYVEYLHAQVAELLTDYGPMGVMWFDGEWESTWLPRYGSALLRHCRSLSPTTIVNNRVSQVRHGMEDVMGDTGSQEVVGDFGTPEQYIPPTGLPGQDWEVCMTIGDHWGHNAYETNWKSSTVLIQNLVDIVSKGGNYLLNVGPKADGTFPEECMERLREIGAWMRVNGEAIYGTEASPFETLPWGRCTRKVVGDRTHLYLHIFDWPNKGSLVVPGVGNDPVEATLLGGEALTVRREGPNLIVDIPSEPLHAAATVVRLTIEGSPRIYRSPRIESPGEEFVGSMTATLVPPEGLTVRYTLDGTTPTVNSPVADGPIRIEVPTTLRAGTFDGTRLVSDVVERTFRRVAPRPGVALPVEAVPGLRMQEYAGNWDRLPDFEALTPRAVSMVPEAVYNAATPEEYIGRVYQGFVIVPEDGMYEFVLTSDDGSRLKIGEVVVVDHDGLHAASAKVGRIALAAGAHPLRVEWFNKTGGAALSVRWALMGTPSAPLATANLRALPPR